MRCGITRPHRILVLTCTVTGSALLWWAFSLSTWAKVDVPDSPQVLFSALFAICSQEVRCWVPPSRSCVCVLLALLLHSLYIWKVTDIFKEAKVTFLYPSFVLSVSITLFFLSGAPPCLHSLTIFTERLTAARDGDAGSPPGTRDADEVMAAVLAKQRVARHRRGSHEPAEFSPDHGRSQWC
ncbi:hypothetical protein MDA_GLEAN10002570 [Myotis davidii]|uniref:Uncharacterized protein n=1 Tax=Myotis davidii TaxID=225400 RepID=L5LTL2_MYODS|nr:hypothetical protein MDA_GLEAN10002570 [Myotis davidii]